MSVMYANYLEIIQISADSIKETVPIDNSGMQSAVTAYSTSKQILLVVLHGRVVFCAHRED